ncbi:hypothetical protein ACFE04_017263 [Oxalis oulophora]
MDSIFKPNPSKPIPLLFKNNSQTEHETIFDKYDHLPVMDTPHVPIIDLFDPRATQLIRSACEKWGVFQVINHGISLDLLDQAERETMKLFALPAARKNLAARTPEDSSGYGLVLMPPFFREFMWFEGFTISGTSPMEHAIKLWPDHVEDRTNFCNAFVKYQKEMKALTEKLFGIMVSSLGLRLEEEFKWLRDGQHHSKLNLNYYPPCPDPTHGIGLAAHTDSSLLTLVHPSITTGGYKGLQVLSEDESSWILIEPMRGAILVNLGDLMKVITNGHFKSVMHRVVVHKSKSRTSRAYFYGPPKELKVPLAEKMVEDGHSALYRPVSWDEMVKAKGQYATRALDSFKI